MRECAAYAFVHVPEPRAQLKRGEPSAESGRLTGDTLKAMIDLALADKLDGICFARLKQRMKLFGFNKGVTVTAGLKTVFTTPAHGTAYDVVGQAKADPGARWSTRCC